MGLNGSPKRAIGDPDQNYKKVLPGLCRTISSNSRGQDTVHYQDGWGNGSNFAGGVLFGWSSTCR